MLGKTGASSSGGRPSSAHARLPAIDSSPSSESSSNSEGKSGGQHPDRHLGRPPSNDPFEQVVLIPVSVPPPRHQAWPPPLSATPQQILPFECLTTDFRPPTTFNIRGKCFNSHSPRYSSSSTSPPPEDVGLKLSTLEKEMMDKFHDLNLLKREVNDLQHKKPHRSKHKSGSGGSGSRMELMPLRKSPSDEDLETEIVLLKKDKRAMAYLLEQSQRDLNKRDAVIEKLKKTNEDLRMELREGTNNNSLPVMASSGRNRVKERSSQQYSSPETPPEPIYVNGHVTAASYQAEQGLKFCLSHVMENLLSWNMCFGEKLRNSRDSLEEAYRRLISGEGSEYDETDFKECFSRFAAEILRAERNVRQSHKDTLRLYEERVDSLAGQVEEKERALSDLAGQIKKVSRQLELQIENVMELHDENQSLREMIASMEERLEEYRIQQMSTEKRLEEERDKYKRLQEKFLELAQIHNIEANYLSCDTLKYVFDEMGEKVATTSQQSEKYWDELEVISQFLLKAEDKLSKSGRNVDTVEEVIKTPPVVSEKALDELKTALIQVYKNEMDFIKHVEADQENNNCAKCRKNSASSSESSQQRGSSPISKETTISPRRVTTAETGRSLLATETIFEKESVRGEPLEWDILMRKLASISDDGETNEDGTSKKISPKTSAKTSQDESSSSNQNASESYEEGGGSDQQRSGSSREKTSDSGYNSGRSRADQSNDDLEGETPEEGEDGATYGPNDSRYKNPAYLSPRNSFIYPMIEEETTQELTEDASGEEDNINVEICEYYAEQETVQEDDMLSIILESDSEDEAEPQLDNYFNSVESAGEKSDLTPDKVIESPGSRGKDASTKNSEKLNDLSKCDNNNVLGEILNMVTREENLSLVEQTSSSTDDVITTIDNDTFNKNIISRVIVGGKDSDPVLPDDEGICEVTKVTEVVPSSPGGSDSTISTAEVEDSSKSGPPSRKNDRNRVKPVSDVGTSANRRGNTNTSSDSGNSNLTDEASCDSDVSGSDDAAPSLSDERKDDSSEETPCQIDEDSAPEDSFESLNNSEEAVAFVEGCLEEIECLVREEESSVEIVENRVKTTTTVTKKAAKIEGKLERYIQSLIEFVVKRVSDEYTEPENGRELNFCCLEEGGKNPTTKDETADSTTNRENIAENENHSSSQEEDEEEEDELEERESSSPCSSMAVANRSSGESERCRLIDTESSSSKEIFRLRCENNALRSQMNLSLSTSTSSISEGAASEEKKLASQQATQQTTNPRSNPTKVKTENCYVQTELAGVKIIEKLQELETAVLEMQEVKEQHMKVACGVAEQLEELKTEEQQWANKEIRFHDEIAAWKQNVELQNAMLRQLREDLECTQKSLQVKERCVRDLQDQIADLQAEVSIPLVEIRLSDQGAQTENRDDVIEYIDKLREENKNYKQELKNKDAIIQEVKRETQGTMAHLLSIKSETSDKIMKETREWQGLVKEKDLEIQHLRGELLHLSELVEVKGVVISQQIQNIKSLLGDLSRCEAELRTKSKLLQQLQAQYQQRTMMQRASQTEEEKLLSVGEQCVKEQHQQTIAQQCERIQKLEDDIRKLTKPGSGKSDNRNACKESTSSGNQNGDSNHNGNHSEDESNKSSDSSYNGNYDDEFWAHEKESCAKEQVELLTKKSNKELPFMRAAREKPLPMPFKNGKILFLQQDLENRRKEILKTEMKLRRIQAKMADEIKKGRAPLKAT